MLSPFLTHNATLADGSGQNLWTATIGKVVDTPVVAIKPRPGGGPGVEITTRGADGAEQVIEFVAALLTASPSAIRSHIPIDNRLITHDAAAMPSARPWWPAGMIRRPCGSTPCATPVDPAGIWIVGASMTAWGRRPRCWRGVAAGLRATGARPQGWAMATALCAAWAGPSCPGADRC